MMLQDTRRHRSGSVFKRLRSVSDLCERGVISARQKAIVKDLVQSGDPKLKEALHRYENGDSSMIIALAKEGSLSRKLSIDLLGDISDLNLDFLETEDHDYFTANIDDQDEGQQSNSISNFNDIGKSSRSSRARNHSLELFPPQEEVMRRKRSAESHDFEFSLLRHEEDFDRAYHDEHDNHNYGNAENNMGSSNNNNNGNDNDDDDNNNNNDDDDEHRLLGSNNIGLPPLIGTESSPSMASDSSSSSRTATKYNKKPKLLKKTTKNETSKSQKKQLMKDNGAISELSDFLPRGNRPHSHSMASFIDDSTGLLPSSPNIGPYKFLPLLPPSALLNKPIRNANNKSELKQHERSQRAKKVPRSDDVWEQDEEDLVLSSPKKRPKIPPTSSAAPGAAGSTQMTKKKHTPKAKNTDVDSITPAMKPTAADSMMSVGKKEIMPKQDLPTAGTTSSSLAVSSNVSTAPTATATLHHNTVYVATTTLSQAELSRIGGPAANDAIGSLGYIGGYSPAARRIRIENFVKKRNGRVWKKRVKYDVRKSFADSRLRVKGRFVKKEDEATLRDLMSMT